MLYLYFLDSQLLKDGCSSWFLLGPFSGAEIDNRFRADFLLNLLVLLVCVLKRTMFFYCLFCSVFQIEHPSFVVSGFGFIR